MKPKKLELKKRTKKIEAPAIIHSEADGWRDTCKRTVEKFNRVEIVTSNPPINGCYGPNYDLIEWHRSGSKATKHS